MVARGDLGLEMPLERVPRAQKEITAGARRQGIPVIVATQVLESMTKEARPTRAEVNDAANAVEDGVDAIMLAGETAAGVYPSRTVLTLASIIREAEASPPLEVARRATDAIHNDHAQALCEAAVMLANRGDAQAIVADDTRRRRRRGGCRRCGRGRRSSPPPSGRHTARRLSLHWGVVPIRTDIGDNLDEASARTGRQLVERGLVTPGAAAVFVSINPDLSRSDANYLKIQRL